MNPRHPTIVPRAVAAVWVLLATRNVDRPVA